MNDLLSLVDWSRAQFALTAMYHWLFVPLTIGLSLIVAIMETKYVRTGDESWKKLTRFWMTIFAINFACGVATGLILEFEFGTNWSNYSWFVGDIFGAPLAIEGLFAFFLESTFVAVMFFGWDKVSKRFHLTATWLVALGVCLSALWILVANAWMQSPVGMEFDPDQMRNTMRDFRDVALSPVALNKFFHAMSSGWALGGAFVVGVSGWMLWRRRDNTVAAMRSMRLGAWVGLTGLLLTMWTGDGSAVQVARTQPMKLAAMEGLYNGSQGQDLVALGFMDTDGAGPSRIITIPRGLSLLAKHDADAFVPGINDIIDGVDIDANGDTINTVSYSERIERGRIARQALADYRLAVDSGHSMAADSALRTLEHNYEFFGYGFLDSPRDAVPPVALTFYSFRIMVGLGCFMLLVFAVALWKTTSRRGRTLRVPRWLCWTYLLMIPVAWIASQAGWIVAEVGRQPWVIQDLMPTRAAISDLSAADVKVTFWIFAALFTALLIAEISIMVRYIRTESKSL